MTEQMLTSKTVHWVHVLLDGPEAIARLKRIEQRRDEALRLTGVHRGSTRTCLMQVGGRPGVDRYLLTFTNQEVADQFLALGGES